MSVWLDGPWMLGLEEGELAEDIAAVLKPEPDGLSCHEVARRLRRRKAAVLEALRSDPRFVHGNHPSRWLIGTQEAMGTNGNSPGANLRPLDRPAGREPEA